MKCEYYFLQNNSVISGVIIEKDKVYIQEGDEKQNLEVNSRDCFNTLISLYSLKDKWEINECDRPICQVAFKEKESTVVYEFNLNNLPRNWGMFMGYISEIVGEVDE